MSECKITIEQRSKRKTCEGELVKARKGWPDPDFEKIKCVIYKMHLIIICSTFN